MSLISLVSARPETSPRSPCVSKRTCSSACGDKVSGIGTRVDLGPATGSESVEVTVYGCHTPEWTCLLMIGYDRPCGSTVATVSREFHKSLDEYQRFKTILMTPRRPIMLTMLITSDNHVLSNNEQHRLSPGPLKCDHPPPLMFHSSQRGNRASSTLR